LAKLPNYRLVKIHRIYTVEDAARCLAVHKNTVRRWIKAGLPTVSECTDLSLNVHSR
jgi:predicted DNA-binding protein (UPF0251 family)